MKGLAESDFTQAFDSLDDVVAYLKGTPVLSKVALVVKETDNGTTYRLILDCSISGTNFHTRQWERITLPKVPDVVNDTLVMMTEAICRANISRGSTCLFVLGFSDAFFQILIAHKQNANIS